MSALASVYRSVVSGKAVSDLQAWATEIEAWAPGSHVWGHYAERTDSGDVICRTENVSACHQGFSDLVNGDLQAASADELGVRVDSFKDKLNYKRPGGAGFSPHQDVLAYPGVQRVMSVLVAIDECTMESGCLWIAQGVEELLPTDERGVVKADVVSALQWSPIELAPGDAVCIAGLTPHYSEKNHSGVSRRVLVASYSAASEGYSRGRYYEARSAGMQRATSNDGKFRISTLADFEGVEVEDGVQVTEGSCTHQ